MSSRTGSIRLSTFRRFVTVVAAAIAAILMTPAVASANRIDNDSSSGNPVDIHFVCGTTCHNDWFDVAPGDWVSRPGHSGPVDARSSKSPVVCERGSVPVGATGEIGVMFARSKGTFTWVSKGGNIWTSPITHKFDSCGTNVG